MTNLDISQAKATVDSKLNLKSFSSYQRKLYGLYQYTKEYSLHALILLRFVLYSWDDRSGAHNVCTDGDLSAVIKTIDQL